MRDTTITKVKTGNGLAGSRVGLIFAPPNASPGSMIALTQFFNAHEDMRAIPGYHGPNKNHVLRISGVQDDDHFLHLLREEFPRWKAEHAAELPDIDVADDLEVEEINEVDHFPHHGVIRKFVKENANSLAGMAYLAASTGLLFSAWRKPKHMSIDVDRDWFKVVAAGSTMMGSMILIAMGHGADNPKDVYSIMEDLYPELKEVDEEKRDHLHNMAERTLSFLQNHPWEISSAVYAVGAGTHLFSAIKRAKSGNTTFEALSALGTLTAMAIAIVVPEKEGRELVDVSNIFARAEQEHSMLDTVDTIQENEPKDGQFIKSVERFKNWAQNSPLAMSAMIQGVANVGYGISAFKRKPFDPGLLTLSAGYLAGNLAQTQATKGRGPGFDDVVTAAASVIYSDPSLKNVPEDVLQKKITLFADALTEKNEIVHNKRNLARGIRERLKRYDLPKNVENKILTGFISSEKKVLKQSPFVSPRYVEETISEPGEVDTSVAIT